VTALKGSEDCAVHDGVRDGVHEDARPDVIVRAVECTGRSGPARIELPLLGRAIVAEFGPHQIRTFRVPVDGGEVREVDLIEWDVADEARGAFNALPAPASSGGSRHSEPDPDSSDATLPAERMAPGQQRRRSI
jgi:alpha-mannosidase